MLGAVIKTYPDAENPPARGEHRRDFILLSQRYNSFEVVARGTV